MTCVRSCGSTSTSNCLQPGSLRAFCAFSSTCFMKQVLENAQNARKEPGCKQFDVLVDPHDRTQVMLYEVYADEQEIGRASCRERVQISVVAVSLKKKRAHQGE